MNTIMAVDPALDGVGVATFDLDVFERFRRARYSDAEAALSALEGTALIRTSPREPLAVRLSEIAVQLASMTRARKPALVYVELPAIHGDYSRGTAPRRTLNSLFMGIGAVLAGIGVGLARNDGGRLIEVRAGTSKKSDRQRTLQAVADLATGPTIRLPYGPRGGVKEDEFDAVWIGWWALLNRVSIDLKSPTKTPALAAGKEGADGACWMPEDG